MAPACRSRCVGAIYFESAWLSVLLDTLNGKIGTIVISKLSVEYNAHLLIGGIELFELVVIILFIWLSIKAIGLAIKLTWGATKILASILMVIALPALIVCMLFASGAILLIPIILIAVAVTILKGNS